MANIVLITGGCRSGKSRYAQQLAESRPAPRLFVATCPVTDEELARRIETHRLARRNRGWDTAEEQHAVADVLRRHAQHATVLVDCVTLWINNLMYAAELAGRQFEEADVDSPCQKVLAAARELRGTVILVTNEVGWGVVPENALARRYRDLVGRANQLLAAEADTVTLVTCGLPLHLKGLTP